MRDTWQRSLSYASIAVELSLPISIEARAPPEEIAIKPQNEGEARNQNYLRQNAFSGYGYMPHRSSYGKIRSTMTFTPTDCPQADYFP